MTPQMVLGVLVAICIGSVYLAVVRKMTVKSFLFALGLCGVVLLAAAHWDTVMQLSHLALAHSSAAPVVHATVKTARPSPVSHHVVSTHTAVSVVHGSVLSLQQMEQPSCIGTVIGVLIVSLIAVKRIKRARPGYQPARQTGTLCPECQKEGDIQTYQYKKGAAKVTGALCPLCAERYRAVVSPREPVKW